MIRHLLKDNKRSLLYIFLIALILRIVALVGVNLVLAGPSLNDDYEYGLIARAIINGKGYSAPIVFKPDVTYEIPNNGYRPTADQLPFYPMVLVLAYSFISSPYCYWIIKIVQCLFSSATCVIIYLIALRIFNRRVALIGGWLSVFYPIFILNNTRLYPEVFLTFWLALTVLYLFVLRDEPSIKNQLITGFLMGITLLNSNIIIPAIPFIGIWILLMPEQWRIKTQSLILILLVAFVTVSPWLWRNYRVFHQFPLMKSTMGLNFYLGNNPEATGTFFLSSGESIYSTVQKKFNKGFAESETDQDKALSDSAVAYVKQDPSRFVHLCFKKFYYFLWFAPNNLISKEGRLFKKLFEIPYGLLLLSGLAGIFLIPKEHWKDTLLLLSIILSVTFLYSIFIVGNQRYRMPIEPYILILSSYTINYFIGKYSDSDQAPLDDNTSSE